MTTRSDHKSKSDAPRPLPMTPQEVEARGWDCVDVVFVTGDAYVDHPSFAMALLGRVLESEGFRVAILSQPDWHSCDAWRIFGRPRLCFAISAGNMDSMLNHYTANRKVRNDDAYSPDGQIQRRPDRATLAYCQRAREAYKGVPVIAGGVEASLRRLAHYDYWSDKVRRSIIFDAKADLVVFGMGERPLVKSSNDSMPAKPSNNSATSAAWLIGWGPSKWRMARGRWTMSGRQRTADSGQWMVDRAKPQAVSLHPSSFILPPSSLIVHPFETVVLPSFEQVSTDKAAFADMTRTIYHEANPYNGRRLVQFHGREAVVVNPPALPLTEEEMDRIYDLPFTRRPHPSYGKRRIPAFDVVKDSIQIVRGCFGGCAFCSITAHEGQVIQSRSEKSILAEIRRMAEDRDFKGVISDLGGPTANMYRMNCSRPEVREKCRRQSCLHPVICPLLATDHGPIIRLMRAARKENGVKQVFIASGIRMDLALQSPKYIDEIAKHHTGGLLKVAPEHTEAEVLELMRKPPIEKFRGLCRKIPACFGRLGQGAISDAVFYRRSPGQRSGGYDPPGLVSKTAWDKARQGSRFHSRPHGYRHMHVLHGIGPHDRQTGLCAPRCAGSGAGKRHCCNSSSPRITTTCRTALIEAGRTDLIGDGPDCLIPSRPPKQIEIAARQSSATHEKPRRLSAPSKDGEKKRESHLVLFRWRQCITRTTINSSISAAGGAWKGLGIIFWIGLVRQSKRRRKAIRPPGKRRMPVLKTAAKTKAGGSAAANCPIAGPSFMAR